MSGESLWNLGWCYLPWRYFPCLTSDATPPASPPHCPCIPPCNAQMREPSLHVVHLACHPIRSYHPCLTLRNPACHAQVREPSLYVVHVAVEMAPVAKVREGPGSVGAAGGRARGSSFGEQGRAVNHDSALDALARQLMTPCHDTANLDAYLVFLHHGHQHMHTALPLHGHCITLACALPDALCAALASCLVPQVGGLGDVVTALGRAVQDQGHLVEVILPK